MPVVVGNALPIITIPVFTRIFTPQDYGVLALANIYAAVVSGLANFGMSAAYDRNYYQYRDDRVKAAQLLYSILLFIILNFVFLAGITYVFRDTIANLVIGSESYGDFLFWATCAFFLTSSSWYFLTYFKNSESPKDYVAYSIVSSLIHFIVSLYLVAYLRIGIIGIVYAQLCSGVIVMGILSFRFMASLPFSLNKERFLEAFQIAYPLTPRILLGVAGTQSDNYIVGLLDSIGGAGIYSIGKKIANMVFTIMTAIENVFSPQMYGKMFDLKERGGTAVGRYLTPFAYISIFLALLMSHFSEEVIILLTPAAYHAAIDVISVLSMYYGSMFIGKITGPQLIYTKKTHITSLLTIINLAITVSFTILFILKWGVIGAAWAMLISGLLSIAISFVVAQSYYKINWEYGKVGAIFIVFFLSTILVISSRNLGIDYSLRLVIKLISLSIYAYIGVKIGVITTENIELMKNMISAKWSIT